MRMSTGRRRLRCTALFLLLPSAVSCATQVRVPLAVPLPAVGGTRPATPNGLELIGEFGDGVWGQEQQRAEMAGGGVGLAVSDRAEVSGLGYHSTRTVEDENGNTHRGETTSGVRAKVRLADLLGGRASVGLHVAFMNSDRREADVQDERLSEWDFAIPVEFHPLGGASVDTRWGVYAGPRVVLQTLEDRREGRSTRGSLIAGLLGVAARWRFFAVAGELNLARPADMGVATTSEGDWILLPMASVRLLWPMSR